MKKIAVLLTLLATVGGNSAFAQSTMGKGAAASSSSSNDFAWGIGLGLVIVIGLVVGFTVAGATDTPSSHSH